MQQLMDFLGAHGSSESKLGDLFRRHILLFPSVTIYFLWIKEKNWTKYRKIERKIFLDICDVDAKTGR
jgi:hypothetical protein